MKSYHHYQSLLLLGIMLPLVGCDQISNKMGLEDPAKKEARLDAEGKAVGSGCRHSGRAIEDCYAIYSWLPKESIFNGWREMDEYMRENHLETIPPLLPPSAPPETGKGRKKAPVPENQESPEAPPAAVPSSGQAPSGTPPAPVRPAK